MRKLIAYRALNEDYTDKVSGVKLIPGNTIPIPEFTTEMFPITLLNVYQLFGNNEKFVTIEMEDAEVDLPASWCQSDKACVVKEIDNTDLIREEILCIENSPYMPTRVPLFEYIRSKTSDNILVTKNDIGKIIKTGYDLSSIVSNCFAAFIMVNGDDCSVNSSGVKSHIFTGGLDNNISSSGHCTNITSLGPGNSISSSGSSSVICAGGDSTDVSASGNNVTIGTLGKNTRINITGDNAQVYCSGDNTIVNLVGKKSIVKCTGKNCIVNVVGDSIVNVSLSSRIILTKTRRDYQGVEVPVDVVTWKVDGEYVLPGVFYKISDSDSEIVVEVDVKEYID